MFIQLLMCFQETCLSTGAETIYLKHPPWMNYLVQLPRVYNSVKQTLRSAPSPSDQTSKGLEWRHTRFLISPESSSIQPWKSSAEC